MKKEIVDQIIKGMSGGNVYLETLLKEVKCVGESKINEWDDLEVSRLNMVLSSGVCMLVGRRISFEEIEDDSEKFWQSPQGQVENRLLINYIVPRLERAKKSNL